MNILSILEPKTLAGTWALIVLSILNDDTLLAEVSTVEEEIGVLSNQVEKDKYLMLKPRHEGFSFLDEKDYPIVVTVYSVSEDKVEALKTMSLTEAGKSGAILDAIGIGEISVKGKVD